MGGYNSKKFSKVFSERTEKNLDYIIKVVNRDEKKQEYREEFLKKYQSIIDEVTAIITSLRNDAKAIPSTQKKGKNMLKKQIYSIADKLNKNKSNLEGQLKELVSTGDMPGKDLYEVTQLLNSLMGIAVLPYEMNKEYFQEVEDDRRTEENRGKKLEELQEEVRNTFEYEDLKDFIMSLYYERKWTTNFHWDLKRNKIDEGKIVFNFLRHLRNVTCHAGDNAMSILPLTEGVVVKDVVFYDKNINNDKEEFAMRLSIEELYELIKKVAMFYQNTKLGGIDKTERIKKVEDKVNLLLKP